MMNEENDVIDSVGRGGLPRPVAVAGGAGTRRVEDAAPKPVAVAGGAGPRVVEPALNRIVKDLAAAPAVDTAKIETLRNAIASGAYKPDADAIASKMIALETPPKKA